MFQAILPKLSISCTLLCTQNLGTVLTQVSNMRKPISTDKSIIALKPEDKEYLVSVKGHQRLYLRVRENGSKSWSYRYNCPISKKAEKISIGTYPNISLARAYEIWAEYEDSLSRNINPKTAREQQKKKAVEVQQNTFNFFANQYFDSLKGTLKENTLNRKYNCVKLLNSYIGDLPIKQITSPKMLEVLLDIQAKFPQVKSDKPSEKAERCASIASDIFNYAIARGYCQLNPALPIKSQLAKPQYGHRPAIIKPDEFAKLLQDIESLTVKVDSNTITSLKLLPMLFVRNGDLRRMRWADVDFKEAKWRFQPLKGEGKEHMVRDMIVPLPHQAITLLEHQYKVNGHSEFVFHSPSAKKHGIISDNTANKHLKEMGYQDIHCVHGFRASAKTMLQEQLKYPAVLVEMALGHVTKDQNGTAYGRFEFFDDRKEMMQAWADYLDALRKGKDVTRFKNRLQNTTTNPEELMKQLIEQLGKGKILDLLK